MTSNAFYEEQQANAHTAMLLCCRRLSIETENEPLSLPEYHAAVRALGNHGLSAVAVEYMGREAKAALQQAGFDSKQIERIAALGSERVGIRMRTDEWKIHGITSVACCQDEYPAQLSKMKDDAPPVIHLTGNRELLDVEPQRIRPVLTEWAMSPRAQPLIAHVAAEIAEGDRTLAVSTANQAGRMLLGETLGLGGKAVAVVDGAPWSTLPKRRKCGSSWIAAACCYSAPTSPTSECAAPSATANGCCAPLAATTSTCARDAGPEPPSKNVRWRPHDARHQLRTPAQRRRPAHRVGCLPPPTDGAHQPERGRQLALPRTRDARIPVRRHRAMPTVLAMLRLAWRRPRRNMRKRRAPRQQRLLRPGPRPDGRPTLVCRSLAPPSRHTSTEPWRPEPVTQQRPPMLVRKTDDNRYCPAGVAASGQPDVRAVRHSIIWGRFLKPRPWRRVRDPPRTFF